MNHYPCSNLFILHNNLFDNQVSEIDSIDIFLCFYVLSITKKTF